MRNRIILLTIGFVAAMAVAAAACPGAKKASQAAATTTEATTVAKAGCEARTGDGQAKAMTAEAVDQSAGACPYITAACGANKANSVGQQQKGVGAPEKPQKISADKSKIAAVVAGDEAAIAPQE